MSLLTYPLHILGAVLRFIFQTLRIPIPYVPVSSLNFGGLIALLRGGAGSALDIDARAEAERWVRALEEETGALSASNLDSSGIAGDAGPSTLRRRQAERTLLLPDFYLGAYEDALRAAQRELRVACIVLVSKEHDDDVPFKRDVLCDPGLVGLLQRENMIVWGGDVRGREAWSAAHKLGATTYPFVAFAALQPPRGLNAPSGSTSGTPLMTVLSRHQGLASVRPPLLTDHLTATLLPRVTPFLVRQRAQAREREFARQLRAEQDAAFEASKARDKQRVEEREMQERKRKQEEREAEERRERVEVQAAQAESAREAWRREQRAAFLPPSAVPGGVKVGIRLPNGARSTVAFAKSASVLSLFAAVDAALRPLDGAEANAASASGSGTGETPDARMREHALGPDEWWGFKIFQSYPRRAIEYNVTRTVGEAGVEGSVSVELVSQARLSVSSAAGEGDDGYDTEDE